PRLRSHEIQRARNLGTGMSRRTQGFGFTLVEVLIVVALIGVLSTVAVPGYLSYQARSRRAEAFMNLQAVARSQVSYFAAKGFYHGTGLSYPHPPPSGGPGPRPRCRGCA